MRGGEGWWALRGLRSTRDIFQLQEQKLLSQRGLKPEQVHIVSQQQRQDPSPRPAQTPWSLTKAILNRCLFELSVRKLLCHQGGGTVIVPIFQMRKGKLFWTITHLHRDTQLGLDPGSLTYPYTPEAITRRPQAQMRAADIFHGPVGVC